MPTIIDAINLIVKLTVKEQETLKTMLLSPSFVRYMNIEDFVEKERFSNGCVCPLFGCTHVVRNGHRKDGTQRYLAELAAASGSGKAIFDTGITTAVIPVYWGGELGIASKYSSPFSMFVEYSDYMEDPHLQLSYYLLA